MTRIAPLLARNADFAATHAPAPLALPTMQSVIVSCLDHRLPPELIFGMEIGDAPVIRNAGGRVTEAVIDDVSYLAFLSEELFVGPSADSLFEVAIVQHTQCGTGFLGDPQFRAKAAQATGLAEDVLISSIVDDPYLTVELDVERLLGARSLSPKVTVSGHVFDVETNQVTTVVAPRRRGDVGRSAQ